MTEPIAESPYPEKGDPPVIDVAEQDIDNEFLEYVQGKTLVVKTCEGWFFGVALWGGKSGMCVRNDHEMKVHHSRWLRALVLT